MWSLPGKLSGVMPPFKGQRKTQRTGAEENTRDIGEEPERVVTERPRVKLNVKSG